MIAATETVDNWLAGVAKMMHEDKHLVHWQAYDLLELVKPYEFVVIITHDIPDADAIAAGWAIKHLLDEETICETRVIAGGEILRSEHRRLVELLSPPLELLEEYFVVDNIALIFVDCGPEASEHLVTNQLFEPIAIINHHDAAHQSDDPPLTKQSNSFRPPFIDIRTNVAATSTIATSYLMQHGIEPGERLATALLYAIRSETRGCEPKYAGTDHDVLAWLMSRANLSLLGDIENAPLSSEYFVDFTLALQSSVIFEDAAFCMLPQTFCPETIGEVADLLIRHKSLRRVLCAAVHRGRVIVSVRTKPGGGHATALLRETIQGLGGAAGHTFRAGGTLDQITNVDAISTDLRGELLNRWLKACHIHAKEPVPLCESTASAPRHPIA